MLQNPNPQQPEGFARQLGAAARHEARDRVGALAMPVHVIGGEHDVLVPVWKSQEIHALVPGSELTVIAGGPHGLNLERADEFNAAVLDFVRARRPRPPPDAMRETADDLLRVLQELIDRSYAAAGPTCGGSTARSAACSAAAVAERLQGMCLLALATVTADGRPIVGPVDSIFFHGAFVFGTSPDSVRWRHIEARPQVSAVHLPGEELAITVHGRAVPVPVDPEDGAELREALLDVYLPTTGESYRELMDSGAVYARIEAERMFTFAMPAQDD